MENADIIEGIKESSIFEFVANNYWKMSKEQLKVICMELDYANSNEVTGKEYSRIVDNALNSMREVWDEG